MKLRTALSFSIFLLSFSPVGAQSQTEVTTQDASSLYRNTSKKRTSVHDPSVVYDPSSQRYYVFGSHKGGAYTTDMQNWTWAAPTWSPDNNASAFVTPAVKKVKNKDGEEVDFPQFNAMDWSARSDDGYSIDGNMWAPDVIWNPTMKKWCMYLSINGDSWHSSIILLTSSNIQGPYRYQGPVVICGFKDSSHSYKDTDLELAIGTQTTLPARYNVGNNWGRRWPHTIDPAVFYDEEGKLWLVYGSWSGGIWMLELDEETGLRDYTVSYPSTNGSSDGVTSDPYFGTKVAGGYYVSGEGPYIEHIGDYYYLFISYGGFAPDGGYEMRVFRSANPNGPYRDASNRSAIFTSYALNYGTGSETRGEKLMGSYNQWGFQTVGECAQGHNSIIAAAEDGRTYLVYHTKFNDGTIGHQVRVHQVFQNKNGWLVAAPFEYNGEETTDADIASQELVSDVQIPGIYQLLVHKYKMDHANMEEVTPVAITLTDDGKVTGASAAYSGTWSREAGTSYLTLKLGNVVYNGVITVQQMDSQSIKSIAFTAMANSGVNVWGYKMHPQYAVAWHVNNQKAPVTDMEDISHNVDLYKMAVDVDNVTLQWSSSHPAIISDYGRYDPTGLADNTSVTLTARVSSADYYWQQAFTVNALSEQNAQPSADWTTGLLAHYGFDDEALTNTFNTSEQAQLLHNGTTSVPTVEGEQNMRNGNVVHLNFGANGKESYVAIQNPLYGKSLEEGATIAFWLLRTDNNLWDALFGLTNGDTRLFMTGNTYVGYNGGDDDWLDINHPQSVTPDMLSVGSWHFVIITFERTARSSTGGVTVYVDGNRSFSDVFNGKLGTTTVSNRRSFDYNHIVDHIAASPQFFLGNGSFWGSPDACFDDVMFYDHALSSQSIGALNTMVNRVFDYTSLTNHIPSVSNTQHPTANTLYDLQGRRVSSQLKKGIYIISGKKVVVK